MLQVVEACRLGWFVKFAVRIARYLMPSKEKNMKAENIFKINSSPAPKEWAEIKEIAVARPITGRYEISLQRFIGTDICMWYTRTSFYWNPASDLFIVKKK